MADSKYTEEEIQWAISKLKEKHPERANRKQAIKFLDTMKDFAKIPVDIIKKDVKSGKLKKEKTN